MDELTGLENELDYDNALDIIEDGSSVEPGSIDIPEADTTVDEYEEEQCTDSYHSNAYGQTYCIGDTIETSTGPMTVTSIWNGQAVTSPVEMLDAEELYDDMGVAMGMSEEQFATFIDSYNELKMEYAALDSSMHVFGPTEMETGRLGIRIKQQNPDWTDEQVHAEVERMLADKLANSEAYADLAAREQELFSQYGMETNGATFGTGTWVGPDGKYYSFNGANGYWQQTSQDDGFLDYAVPIGIAVGAALITAGGAGSVIGGSMPGWAAGGIKAALGSAVSQGLVTGSIDPNALLKASITGAVGGLFSDLSSMDGSIFSDATGLTGAADTAVEGLSKLLNIPYDEALKIAQGIVTGVVTGDDMESIIANAAGSYTQSQIMDMLKATYGDTMDVDDWFKDGESHIPVDALEPVIGQVIDGVINGTIDDPGAWASTIWDYFQAGGDIDFMLPPGVNIGDWFGESFGCPEWAKTEAGNCVWDGVSGWNPEIDAVECMPGWDWDAGLRQCLPIPNPCGEGLIWDADLGECIPDVEIDGPDIDVDIDPIGCGEGETWDEVLGQCIPDVLECMEGFEWSDLYGECVPKIQDDIDVLECQPGYEWDVGLRQCLPIQNPCGEGLIWDADLGECIPDINIEGPDFGSTDCENGFHFDSLLGQCMPDYNLDIDGPDMDITNPCEEGQYLDEAGLCQWPDMSLPESNFTPYNTGPRAKQYDVDPWKDVDTGGVRDLLVNPLLDDNGMF